MSKTDAQKQDPTDGAETLIGRQPIFDRDMNVVAYELLFRSGEANRADVLNHNEATSQVIINAFMEIGIADLVGDKLAYINMPSAFLQGIIPIPFPQEKAVLEVLEHVEATDEVIEGIRKLSLAGYTIALDDFVFTENTRRLLGVANIVKVDVMNGNAASVTKAANQLRPHRVKLLAEKIETRDMFELCKKAGYELFQGYFLCRPNVVKGARIPANGLQLLKLLSELNNPDIQFHALEKTVSSDVGLSYKLLRVVNSAQYAMRQKVESLHHALVLLGVQKIKEWATLITLTSVPDKPAELFVISLQRARYCQWLAQDRGAPDADAYFTAGLFSTLDALLDKPFSELLPQLSLTDDLNRALSDRTGPIGDVLKAVVAYENGDWEHAVLPSISNAKLRQGYLDAVQWARDAAAQLSSK